ncbi:pyridoxamine 5'-phosphate oxidase [Naumannella halotolerans]|uniref:Pyridoxamine 5'-phosphate oxidase n=2 Tax=Naumannella halotolerans TaxID=993414 RepID=A0A4R7JA81_9ACTN|nr:pyridoxamine 5'-phosphate oxidase [Naumannella halotolerans]
MPDGYGLPDSPAGLLDWPTVAQRLIDAKHYWLSTVRPDGTPHSVPRWGVWVDDRFYYDGAPTTRHVRNLQTNTAVTLTLESGAQAVIVEGRSVATCADPETLGAQLSAAFAKYAGDGYSPGADAWSGADGGGLRVIVPERVLAWLDFPTDCTRFTFG